MHSAGSARPSTGICSVERNNSQLMNFCDAICKGNQIGLLFLKFMICSIKYLIMALGSLRFFTLSETPSMSPAYLTKYSRSLFSHLFVSCDRRTLHYYEVYFSNANSSSKSNSSRLGLGSSRRIGGNTAGANPRSGVSNCGTMSVSTSCLTASVS